MLIQKRSKAYYPWFLLLILSSTIVACNLGERAAEKAIAGSTPATTDTTGTTAGTAAPESPDDASASLDSTSTTLASTDATGPTAGAAAPDWTRVPDDESVMGGPDFQAMVGVAAGGPGLVAVGNDYSGGDWDAAVWTSTDGVVWTRVPHDESVLGGPDDQAMWNVVAGGPGLVAVGWDSSDGDWDAAVWVILPSD